MASSIFGFRAFGKRGIGVTSTGSQKRILGAARNPDQTARMEEKA